MIRFVPWSEVGTITVSPGDNVVEVGAFELAEGADTLWVRMTNTGTQGPWPWSYGILSFKTDEGQPLGSIKAYNSFDGEVFRLGVGLPPSVRAGVLTFEPRGFNMAWIRQGNPWSLRFEAQSGGQSVTNTYWSRVPGTLAPSNEGDSINLDEGGITAFVFQQTDDTALITSDGIVWSKYGMVRCGEPYGDSVGSQSSVELRGGERTPYGALRLQGPSDTANSSPAIRVNRGGVVVWDLNYDGSATFRSSIAANDLELISSDPQFYRATPDGEDYVGPSLSIVDEIVRLEALVKELYEKLRMNPDGGWPVWDGNEDVINSNIAKLRQI